MSTLHNRGPPAALPGALNYINSLTAKDKAADQRVSPIRPVKVSPIRPVAQGALPKLMAQQTSPSIAGRYHPAE